MLQRRQVDLLLGERWAGHPALKWPLPPSTSPCSPAFNPACYWRGPVWPVFNWLLTWALRRGREEVVADKLAAQGIAQLGDGSFAEYYHALTGEPLGSGNQSWTAATALDWLLAND
jgi:glycogen debranching enzyme